MLSAKAVDRWAEDWADGLNPILVKETRQVFKTHLVTIPFFVALVVAWFVSMSVVIEPAHPESVLGPRLLMPLLMVLGAALFYVVPYISFRSMTAERERHTFEMLAVSSLSDTQIFWGKLSSALVVIGLFVAAFAPFISMTYMLRGLSVFDILAALIVIAATATMLSLFGLMLGALATKLHFQIMNMLLLLFGSTIAAIFLSELTASIAYTGGGVDLCGMTCFLIGFVGFPGLFFAAVTLGSLRPPTIGLVRTYVGQEDLPAIVQAADHLAETIEQHVPLRPESYTLRHLKKVTITPEAVQSMVPVVVRMERLLNPRQRQFGHLGRYRYLTIKGAAEPLEMICTVQNMVLHRFGWSELCAADADEIPLTEEQLVYTIGPDDLRVLKLAVSRLGELLDRDEPPELEEAGIFSERPEADALNLSDPNAEQQ
ncbi:ABC transporter permease [Symmachiella dynata]|uniref:ABC transporter permease n=1 Tax=Symmachiella dynata TaxID=2527995 RepID=UPI0030EDBDEC